jgi:hypothetical protein
MLGWVIFLIRDNEQMQSGDSVQYVNVPDFGYSQSVPQLSKGDRADLIDKLKPDLIIEVIRHRLMGELLQDNVWIKVPELQDRSLSEKGAWDLSNLMLGTANLNVSMSMLDDYEIKNRLKSICRTAQYLCVANWQKYRVINKSQLYFVNDILFTNGLVVLKHAQDAGFQMLLKGTVTENRMVSEPLSKPGLLSRLKRGILGGQ